MAKGISRGKFAAFVLGGLGWLGLAACSGGGSAPPADLNGYWMVFLTPAGFNEVGPSAEFMTQTGNTVDGAAITGTTSGSAFTVASTSSSAVATLTGSANGDNANGSFSVTGSISVNGTFRMVRFAPTGTMTVSGTLQGIPVNLDLTTAIGSRDYTDPTHTVLAEVELIAAIGDVHLEIDLSPGGLAVGALAVPGTVTANVAYRDDSNDFEVAATSGTVTVTQYDANGFAGSFSLTLGADTLTGTFDVAWDIASH